MISAVLTIVTFALNARLEAQRQRRAEAASLRLHIDEVLATQRRAARKSFALWIESISELIQVASFGAAPFGFHRLPMERYGDVLVHIDDPEILDCVERIQQLVAAVLQAGPLERSEAVTQLDSQRLSATVYARRRMNVLGWPQAE